jgi:hypothetical protein
MAGPAMVLGAAYALTTLWTFCQLYKERHRRAAYVGLPAMVVLGLLTGGAAEQALLHG